MALLQELTEPLLQYLNYSVLPRFQRELQLSGIIAYGSHVAGFARQKSDLDLLVLVHATDGRDFYGQYFGMFHYRGNAWPIEIRVYTTARLFELLEGDEPHRLYALTKSVTLKDDDGKLSELVPKARLKFAQLIERFKDGLSDITVERVLPLLQIAATDSLYSIESLVKENQFLAAISKFQEFLVDYIVYSEACHRITSGSDSEEYSLTNFYFLTRFKGGRFLHSLKYEWPERYTQLIEMVNYELRGAIISFRSPFEVLDQHFQRSFQKPLLLTNGIWPSLWIEGDLK